MLWLGILLALLSLLGILVAGALRIPSRGYVRFRPTCGLCARDLTGLYPLLDGCPDCPTGFAVPGPSQRLAPSPLAARIGRPSLAGLAVGVALTAYAAIPWSGLRRDFEHGFGVELPSLGAWLDVKRHGRVGVHVHEDTPESLRELLALVREDALEPGDYVQLVDAYLEAYRTLPADDPRMFAWGEVMALCWDWCRLDEPTHRRLVDQLLTLEPDVRWFDEGRLLAIGANLERTRPGYLVPDHAPDRDATTYRGVADWFERIWRTVELRAIEVDGVDLSFDPYTDFLVHDAFAVCHWVPRDALPIGARELRLTWAIEVRGQCDLGWIEAPRTAEASLAPGASRPTAARRTAWDRVLPRLCDVRVEAAAVEHHVTTQVLRGKTLTERTTVLVTDLDAPGFERSDLSLRWDVGDRARVLMDETAPGVTTRLVDGRARLAHGRSECERLEPEGRVRVRIAAPPGPLGSSDEILGRTATDVHLSGGEDGGWEHLDRVLRPEGRSGPAVDDGSFRWSSLRYERTIPGVPVEQRRPR